MSCSSFFSFFFFNDTATTEIYTLSLHDALPIWYTTDDLLRMYYPVEEIHVQKGKLWRKLDQEIHAGLRDRKSTRLNSSHLVISYAVFCLKKKKREMV